jgi:hypothetical protein
MNIESKRVSALYVLGAVFMGMILITTLIACRQQSKNASKSDSFYLTNAFMDGKKVQILKCPSGIGILPTKTNVTIRFGDRAWLSVTYNKDTLKPQAIVLETEGSKNTPGQTVYDVNADGIPDMRELEGESRRQLLFHGSWYYYEVAGTNNIIMYESTNIPVYFNGSAWQQSNVQPNTNSDFPKYKSPSGSPVGIESKKI